LVSPLLGSVSKTVWTCQKKDFEQPFDIDGRKSNLRLSGDRLIDPTIDGLGFELRVEAFGLIPMRPHGCAARQLDSGASVERAAFAGRADALHDEPNLVIRHPEAPERRNPSHP
jgi:hypothetical protein